MPLTVQHRERCLQSQRGLTLIEMMVSIGLLSLVLTLAGTALFQVMGAQRWWLDNAVATRDLRHGLSAYGNDAGRAELVDLADGAGPAASLTITWTDATGGLKTSTYAQDGDTFTRAADSSTTILTRNVTSVVFNRTGKTLELQLTVETPTGQAKNQSLQVYAGRLP